MACLGHMHASSITYEIISIYSWEFSPEGEGTREVLGLWLFENAKLYKSKKLKSEI